MICMSLKRTASASRRPMRQSSALSKMPRNVTGGMGQRLCGQASIVVGAHLRGRAAPDAPVRNPQQHDVVERQIAPRVDSVAGMYRRGAFIASAATGASDSRAAPIPSRLGATGPVACVRYRSKTSLVVVWGVNRGESNPCAFHVASIVGFEGGRPVECRRAPAGVVPHPPHRRAPPGPRGHLTDRVSKTRPFSWRPGMRAYLSALVRCLVQRQMPW